ncbi:GNAT family N-acetyltransferase [Nocardioides sp. YIM 152588]|uniref:GNAT family N-acetyltransferase n=1 Tax=Nocardioides sp. YIM 152588 TaxID=3158259 RepID=UPI0032E3C6F0
MQISLDDPRRDDVLALLTEHLDDMYATSPAESVHALDPDALARPEISFWTLREDGALLGCAALKELDPAHAEIKSMRSANAARRRGVGVRLLDHLVAVARERGYARLSLETGTEDYFLPARTLYGSRGFVACEPFADYTHDPNSAFLTLELAAASA